MRRQLYYVAHPLSGDVQGNLARALRWLAWLAKRDADRAYIAPWIAFVMAGASDNDPVARARGLADDVAVVTRCDGIVLCGGRVSRGMATERDAMVAICGEILDLTHLGEEPPE